jgi:hypothetical protein
MARCAESDTCGVIPLGPPLRALSRFWASSVLKPIPDCDIWAGTSLGVDKYLFNDYPPRYTAAYNSPLSYRVRGNMKSAWYDAWHS